MAQKPVGGHSLLEYHRAPHEGQFCLTASLMTWTKCTLRKFADVTKWVGVADIPEGCDAIEEYVGNQEKWAERSLITPNSSLMKDL